MVFVTGNELLVQSLTPNLDLEIGGEDATFLNSTELAKLTGTTLTIGRANGSGAITVTGNVTFNAPVTLQSPVGLGSINTQGFNITGDTSVTLQAGDSITLDAGSIISSNSGALNVTLNADRDANGAGAIRMNPGSAINSNGGNIVLGGGLDPKSDPAVGTANDINGILINGATLNAGTGNIRLTGTGNGSGNGSDGIEIFNSRVESTGNGAIYLTGTGGNRGGANDGIIIEGSRITSDNGNISLTGTGNGPGSGSQGIQMRSSNVNISNASVVESTETGNITLTGTGASGAEGIRLENSSIINSSGGNISLTGTSSELSGIFIGDGYGDFIGDGYGNEDFETVPSQINSREGDITLTADEIDLEAGSSITGTGTLQLQPLTSSLGITVGGTIIDARLNLDTSELNTIQNGFSQIFIGRNNSSGGITVADEVTFNDPVTLRSPLGNIEVNGTITGADDASVTLIGSGATTTLNADIITAGNPITIEDKVVLRTDVTLNTTAQDQPGAGIEIDGTIDGTTAGAESLTLTARHR